MEPWQIALLIKPFAFLAYFAIIWCLAKFLTWLIPAGRIKRLLLRRIGPDTDRRGR